MLLFMHNQFSIQKDNTLSSINQELRKYFKGYICWQVLISYIMQKFKLIGFYAGAILLRYEYPSMIITKTKQIFLKRLKRNKKMLTQQGSSDQSQQHSQSKTIKLHTNTFLSSVNSSELSKKTAQLKDQGYPQILEKTTNQKSFDSSIHDINNPNQVEKSDTFTHTNDQFLKVLDQSFADKLQRISKKAQLTQFIDKQTVQINLHPIQSQISHLISDFDQIDRQQIIKNYLKLKNKQKQNYIDVSCQFSDFQQIIPNEYRKKASTFYMTQNQPILNQKIMNMKYKKNNIINNQTQTQTNSQFYKKHPKQLKFSQIYDNQYQSTKNRLKNQFKEMKDNKNQINSKIKMSAFYDTKQQSAFNDISQQYRNKSEIQANNRNKQIYFQHYNRINGYGMNHNSPRAQINNKMKRNFVKKSYQPQFQNQLQHYYFQKPRQKIISHHTYDNINNLVQRNRSNNIQGLDQQYQILTQRQKQSTNFGQRNKYQKYKKPQNTLYLTDLRHQQNPYNLPINSTSRSSYLNKKYINDYSPLQRMKNERISPRIERNYPLHIYRQTHYPETQYEQNINIYPATHRIFEKKSNLNSPKHDRNTHTQPNNEIEIDYQDKKQRKRKIREKASQLLNRVRSQQYLNGRVTSSQYIYAGTTTRGY